MTHWLLCRLPLLPGRVSQTFQSGPHRAFLFSSVVNVYHGPPCDRPLRTGLHVVSDLYCRQCHVNVGWYYNLAYEQSQKYKENKFILVENTIYKQDTTSAAADGQVQSDGSRSSRRTSHDSSGRTRDEEDEDEEDEEQDEDEQEGDEAEEQREGRARGGGRRSVRGWMEQQSMMLASPSTLLPHSTAAGAAAIMLTRSIGRTAAVRNRVPHAPSAS